jgi:hypothetical protein
LSTLRQNSKSLLSHTPILSRSSSRHSSTFNLALIAAEIIGPTTQLAAQHPTPTPTAASSINASQTQLATTSFIVNNSSSAIPGARPPLVSFCETNVHTILQQPPQQQQQRPSFKSSLKHNEVNSAAPATTLSRTASELKRNSDASSHLHENDAQQAMTTSVSKPHTVTIKSPELRTQGSIMSAPADLNLAELGEGEEGRLSKKNRLVPLELPLSTSFASNSSYLTTTYTPGSANGNRPHFMQQMSADSGGTSVVPAVKGLNKTRGSKAMRVMGNNNVNAMSNGPAPLKSGSASAMSGKSVSSHFSRMNAAATKKLQQKRLFFKNGNINISRCNIDKRRRRYLTDIFTTLIDLKWRYNLLVFLLGFFISWMFFAFTWYSIALVHGDLRAENLEMSNYTACVNGMHGFAGAILFSIETQQTIGYGARYTTEKCPEAIFVMMIQSSVGVMIQSFMVNDDSFFLIFS